MKYQKKPIVIEAVQYTGDNFDEIQAFVNETYILKKFRDYMIIQTLEGIEKATPGYYIIKGVRGEFYPCEESIFNETYTKADATGQYGILWLGTVESEYERGWPPISPLDKCKETFKRYCGLTHQHLSENGLSTLELNAYEQPASFIQVIYLPREVGEAIDRMLMDM
jgi:hypothetical protein